MHLGLWRRTCWRSRASYWAHGCADIQAAPGTSEADAAPCQPADLKGQHSFDRASQRLRQLYRSEPLWEYGVNFSLYFILAQGCAGWLRKRSDGAVAER